MKTSFCCTHHKISIEPCKFSTEPPSSLAKKFPIEPSNFSNQKFCIEPAKFPIEPSTQRHKITSLVLLLAFEMWHGAWQVQVINTLSTCGMQVIKTLSTCDHIEPWAARAAGLVFAQYFWFRHCFLLTGEQGQQVQQLVVHMLSDKKLEVQDLAASSLSGQYSVV